MPSLPTETEGSVQCPFSGATLTETSGRWMHFPIRIPCNKSQQEGIGIQAVGTGNSSRSRCVFILRLRRLSPRPSARIESLQAGLPTSSQASSPGAGTGWVHCLPT